jgi:hypothetical protein
MNQWNPSSIAGFMITNHEISGSEDLQTGHIQLKQYRSVERKIGE